MYTRSHLKFEEDGSEDKLQNSDDNKEPDMKQDSAVSDLEVCIYVCTVCMYVPYCH